MPVEAHAARVAPTNRAWVKAAVMQLSLKLPRGIHPLVLQEQPSRLHARKPADGVRGVQQRLAFADGDALIDRHERQQVVEPPDAAEAVRQMALGPFFFRSRPICRARGACPNRTGHPAGFTLAASDHGLVNRVGSAASGRDALLIRGVSRADFYFPLEMGSRSGFPKRSLVVDRAAGPLRSTPSKPPGVRPFTEDHIYIF